MATTSIHLNLSRKLNQAKLNQTKREYDNLCAKLYQQRLSQAKDSVPESAAAPASEGSSAGATTEPEARKLQKM